MIPRLPSLHPLAATLIALMWSAIASAATPTDAPVQGLDDFGDVEIFVNDFCIDCHSGEDAEADFRIDDLQGCSDDRQRWELVWKRVASRQMPPPDAERPGEETYGLIDDRLAAHLDAVSFGTSTASDKEAGSRLRRMTRNEYAFAVKDLLDVDIDPAKWLIKDESSNGFDNLTVSELSPLALSRYLVAARSIASLAVGPASGEGTGRTVRLPADLTQETHLPGLPLGSRGGTAFEHDFPHSGHYRFAMRLTRDRDEKVEGLSSPHDLDVIIDDHRRHRFHLTPPPNGDDTLVDANLKVDLFVTAGRHRVTVTFADDGERLREIKRQPFDAAFNRHRHPRTKPALFEVSLFGPVASPVSGAIGSPDLAPAAAAENYADEEAALADDELRRWLRPILRRAYRREIDVEDLVVPMRVAMDDPSPRRRRESALASVLSSPHFLFRSQPIDPHTGHLTATALASRLSFFLWSSLPDAPLLDSAADATLLQPQTLRRHVDRMLADPRSDRLVTNFAAQWLMLRNLDALTPDLRAYPDFDENLRRSARDETESLLRFVFERNRPVTELIHPPRVFLDRRLANHYGIATVQHSDMRSYPADQFPDRGGLLRQTSLLMLTSHATRTSPTIRGNYVLTHLLGTPAPPPPPNVPPLASDESSAVVAATIAEQLAKHRSDSACASCHALMDPIGLAMENYDAVGRFRLYDGSSRIDAEGILPDGTEVRSLEDLEAAIVRRPRQLASTLVSKLLTFALGRPMQWSDAAAIRRITNEASRTDFRFQSIIHAIVSSDLFRS